MKVNYSRSDKDINYRKKENVVKASSLDYYFQS